MGFLAIHAEHGDSTTRALPVDWRELVPAASGSKAWIEESREGTDWICCFDPGAFLHEDQHVVRAGAAVAGPGPSGKGRFDDWIQGSEGSFAAIEYDRRERRVRIARDRFGGMPVYWLEGPGLFIASTKIELIARFAARCAPDPLGWREAIAFRWLSGKRSLVAGISQLLPGHMLEWAAGVPVVRRQWWRLVFPADGTGEAESQREMLHDALSRSTLSLVSGSRRPALLLSGGVDSSVIAAVAAASGAELACFIGSVAGEADEEVRRARLVATRLGMSLEVVNIDRSELAEDLHRVVSALGEPPRNPNNLVLVQLYRAMAARGVDLVLNGDGAEMLLGLDDVRRVASFSRKHAVASQFLPGPVRGLVAGRCALSHRSRARRLAKVLAWSPRRYAAALDALAYSPGVLAVLDHDGPGSFPAAGGSEDVLAQHVDLGDALQEYQSRTTLMSSQRRHDALARSAGLVAACPYLHPSMLGFAQQLPRQLRYTTRSRPLLKDLCDRLVGPEVARLPKIGFSVPWRDWMTEELRELVGAPGDYAGTTSILPEGFVEAAFRTRDCEALFTAMASRLIYEALFRKY